MKAGASRSCFSLAVLVVATGVVSGLGGMAEILLLHWVQRVGYGYGFDPSVPVPSFLEGVMTAPAWRRIAAMTAGGLVAGFGWWALRSRGRPLVGLGKTVRPDGPDLPTLETLADAVLQAVTVALGSPLGREVAPRQVAAVLTQGLARAARASREDLKLLVACGAGAGLAAAYNVPLGGGVFALETMLGTLSPLAVVAALATSTIAARVAWIGTGNYVPYTVAPMAATPSLSAWALAAGPFFGLLAHMFSRGASAAGARKPSGAWIVPWCLLTFAALGLVATRVPEILGNGRGPAQLEFGGQVAPLVAATWGVLKLLAVLAALRAGAVGGLLTPSLALGALVATSLGGVWSHLGIEGPPAALAIVGAAAFLAASQQMPLAATVLVIEFTRVEHDFYIPIVLAACGAAGARLACTRWEGSRVPRDAAHADRPG